jgi:ferrochelatase
MGDHEVLLLGHGTVENLDDLPAFLSNIRRGRPSPPELVREIQRRYEAIGGSPLLRISRELAGVLEARLGTRVHLAMRFWHPFAKDVLAGVASSGCRALFVVPLAPYSGHVYAGEWRASRTISAKAGSRPLVRSAPNWGKEPALVDAFAAALLDALARLPEPRRVAAHVLFTAHSLPLAIVRQGDPYPDEVRATARPSPRAPQSPTPGASSTRARARRPTHGSAPTSARAFATSQTRTQRTSSSARSVF